MCQEPFWPQQPEIHLPPYEIHDKPHSGELACSGVTRDSEEGRERQHMGSTVHVDSLAGPAGANPL